MIAVIWTICPTDPLAQEEVTKEASSCIILTQSPILKDEASITSIKVLSFVAAFKKELVSALICVPCTIIPWLAPPKSILIVVLSAPSPLKTRLSDRAIWLLNKKSPPGKSMIAPVVIKESMLSKTRSLGVMPSPMPP